MLLQVILFFSFHGVKAQHSQTGQLRGLSLIVDVGMFVQTLCLSATGHGLGSCILGYPLIVEPAIRDFLQIPESRRIMVCVALGFPDSEQPMAQFESSRAELEENIHFVR